MLGIYDFSWGEGDVLKYAIECKYLSEALETFVTISLQVKVNEDNQLV